MVSRNGNANWHNLLDLIIYFLPSPLCPDTTWQLGYKSKQDEGDSWEPSQTTTKGRRRTTRGQKKSKVSELPKTYLQDQENKSRCVWGLLVRLFSAANTRCLKEMGCKGQSSYFFSLHQEGRLCNPRRTRNKLIGKSDPQYTECKVIFLHQPIYFSFWDV